MCRNIFRIFSQPRNRYSRLAEIRQQLYPLAEFFHGKNHKNRCSQCTLHPRLKVEMGASEGSVRPLDAEAATRAQKF
jgi:hypothetical protein